MKDVVLSNPILGEVSFEKSHAERILAYDAEWKLTNWTLHDPKLTYKDGKIIPTKSAGVDNNSQEQGKNI